MTNRSKSPTGRLIMTIGRFRDYFGLFALKVRAASKSLVRCVYPPSEFPPVYGKEALSWRHPCLYEFSPVFWLP